MCVSCVCSALLSSVLVFFEEVKKCALFLSLMAVGFLLLTLLLLSSSLILCGGDAGGVCVCVCATGVGEHDGFVRASCRCQHYGTGRMITKNIFFIIIF